MGTTTMTAVPKRENSGSVEINRIQNLAATHQKCMNMATLWHTFAIVWLQWIVIALNDSHFIFFV